MDTAGIKMYEKDGKRGKTLPFKADEDKLLGWLSRRVQSLKAVRREFESLWREIRQYIEPSIGLGLLEQKDRDKTAAERDDRKILNSEVRMMAVRYAAGMQSGITNPMQPWFQFVAQSDDEKVVERQDMKDFLATITRRCGKVMQRGNIYQTTNKVYLHSAVFGTSCCLLLRGEEPGEAFLHLIDEGDYWIAEDRYQRVDTCLRRIEMTLDQARGEFGESALPENWQDMVRNGKLEERVTVWNLICPNDGDKDRFADVGEKPFASIYWAEGGDQNSTKRELLDIRPFSYNPIVCYRHDHCGSVYGKGIGEMSLPDVKEVQRLEEYKLRFIADEITPAQLADSSLKGRINDFPGGVTYFDGMGGTGVNPIRRLHETRENAAGVQGQIQEVLARIGRMWYNDLFAAMMNINATKNKQLTAREVNEISGEKVSLLGPVLMRMDHDFLTPLTDAIFDIQQLDGFVTDVPEDFLYGEMEIGTEYISALYTEAVANLKKRGIFNVLDVAGMVAQVKPEVVDKIYADRVIDEFGAIYPDTAKIIVETKDCQRMRAQRAEAQARQMREAQMAELAKGAGAQAKALSETKVGNGSALDALIEQAGR